MANHLLAGLTAINTLSPLVVALIAELRSGDSRTDEQIIEAARQKVRETQQIAAEDMSDRP